LPEPFSPTSTVAGPSSSPSVSTWAIAGTDAGQRDRSGGAPSAVVTPRNGTAEYATRRRVTAHLTGLASIM
jgi:hypothetical protein